MNLQQTLKRIKSSDEKEFYELVTNAAIFLTTGGYIKQANKLLSELWKHKLDHDRTTWFADGAFNVAWLVSNELPDYIPFELFSLNEMEISQREYVAVDKWAYPMQERNLEEATGTDLIRIAFRRAKMVGQNEFPSEKNELEALAYLEKAIAEDELPEADVFALAGELAAKHGFEEKAILFLKKWALQSRLMSPAMICRNRHLAPLLLDRVIAKELNLTERICDQWVEEIAMAADERIRLGKTLTYGTLTWRQLLTKIERTAKKDSREIFLQMKPFKKAKIEAIDEIEKRLGLKLPDDYKDFLLVSNGLPEISIVFPKLCPVEEIEYFKNKEPYSFQTLYADYQIFDEATDYGDFMDRCILLSNSNCEEMVWMIPPMNGQKNWETWFVAHWIPGEERYSSFRDYVESILLNLENQQ